MKTLDSLTKEQIKEILENMDWTEIEGDKILVKDTFGETILEIKDFEVETMLDVFLEHLMGFRE